MGEIRFRHQPILDESSEGTTAGVGSIIKVFRKRSRFEHMLQKARLLSLVYI